jgi:hypothetical protein
MPSNRIIFNAVENYLLTTTNKVEYYASLPYYRTLVRRLIPLEIQEYYWEHCYSFVNGVENYLLNCPKGAGDDFISKTVESTVSNSEIKPSLTRWSSHIIDAPSSLGGQKIGAKLVID